jgi:phosphoribosyl 1,2-cyclic phosphate phosphodiesterase
MDSHAPSGEDRGDGPAASRHEETSGSPFPLAYCTDVSAVPPKSWQRLTGLKTLVLDALRHRHHPTHLTLEQAVNIADRVGAERTYFVHMAHDLPHEETQTNLPEGMFLAWDGLILGI